MHYQLHPYKKILFNIYGIFPVVNSKTFYEAIVARNISCILKIYCKNLQPFEII